MRCIMIGITVLTVFVFGVVMAAPKPDFSGAWVMDRARSFGLPPNMQQSMTITQTAEQIDIDTKLVTGQGERTFKDSYILDGKEREFIPQGPAGPAPNKGKRTANWLPGDRGIVVYEVTTNETPKGPVTNRLTRKWTLSSDGELIIDMYIDNPDLSFETKRIFTKK